MGAMKYWPSKRVKIRINYRYHPLYGTSDPKELPRTTAKHNNTNCELPLDSRDLTNILICQWANGSISQHPTASASRHSAAKALDLESCPRRSGAANATSPFQGTLRGSERLCWLELGKVVQMEEEMQRDETWLDEACEE